MLNCKKLIEVALPLEAINREAAREKSIRHGHPSTLHLWWARRPLAACRAVLFASLVDDPSAHPEQFPTEEAQEAERQRLFRIIEELVKWENSNNERVLQAARAGILKSTDGNPPPVYDPFCGGGSIPLEAQRLGLEAHASDLNPVAVLITKALIEIPPTFAGRPPVNPKSRDKMDISGSWKGAAGLAEDVRYYGQWMRDEAEKRIGRLYPGDTDISKDEAQACADSVATYFGFGVSKVADYNSTLVLWSQTRDQAKATFARHAIPMVWDYAEVNPFASAAGDFTVSLRGMAETVERSINSRKAIRQQGNAEKLGAEAKNAFPHPPIPGFSVLQGFLPHDALCERLISDYYRLRACL